MLYLGIDQHRKQLTVCVRDEQGDVIFRRQVSTRWEQARAFLAEIRKRADKAGFVAILEVCGFNDWLVKLLNEYGCPGEATDRLGNLEEQDRDNPKSSTNLLPKPRTPTDETPRRRFHARGMQKNPPGAP